MNPVFHWLLFIYVFYYIFPPHWLLFLNGARLSWWISLVCWARNLVSSARKSPQTQNILFVCFYWLEALFQLYTYLQNPSRLLQTFFVSCCYYFLDHRVPKHPVLPRSLLLRPPSYLLFGSHCVTELCYSVLPCPHRWGRLVVHLDHFCLKLQVQ